MTEIYFVRHAEADGNAYRRIHGQYDSLITTNGYRQIEALSRRFASIDVDACYASDLTRTCITARAIYLPKKLPLYKDAAFREIHVGVWDDIPFGWLHRFVPDLMNQFNKDPLNWAVEGSEPFMVYTDRFLKRLKELAIEHDGQTIAIVSHGCALRGVLLRLFFDPTAPSISYCDNTAVSHLFYENGKFTYDYINDNSHLTPDISTLIRQKKDRPDSDPREYNLWYQPLQNEEDFSALVRQMGLGYIPSFADLSRKGEVQAAMRKEETIGLVATELIPHSKQAELKLIVLKQMHRGKRFGTQLFGTAVSFARAHGKSQLIANVDAEDEATIGFLIHNGMNVSATSGYEKKKIQFVKDIDPANVR